MQRRHVQHQQHRSEAAEAHAGDLIGELLPKQYVWRFVPDELVAVTPDSALNPVLSVKYGVKVMAYNSELNPKGCPISNIWDLTEPAWKGKMFVEDPLNDASQMALMVTIIGHPTELAAAYKDKYGKDPVLDADTPDAVWRGQIIHQHTGGCGMLVCSQPWVTAKSRAASREAKALSKRNTRQ